MCDNVTYIRTPPIETLKAVVGDRGEDSEGQVCVGYALITLYKGQSAVVDMNIPRRDDRDYMYRLADNLKYDILDYGAGNFQEDNNGDS